MNIDFKSIVGHCLNVVKNQYFCFSGRASRRFFWMYMIPVMILSCLPWIGQLIALILLCPTLGISARRLHDIGKSAWLLLIVLIPFIGLLVLLYLYCQPGEGSSNKYGDPQAE